MKITLDIDALLAECHFQTALGGGPGGQHVNKTETQVRLYFPVLDSNVLTEWQKTRLMSCLANRINKEGVLILKSQDYRSQHKNREKVQARFIALLKEAIQPPKPRKATRPTRASQLNRLDRKKHRSKLKQTRRPPDW